MDPITIAAIIGAVATNAGPVASDIKSLVSILQKQLKGEPVAQTELDFLEQQRAASQTDMDAAADAAIASAS